MVRATMTCCGSNIPCSSGKRMVVALLGNGPSKDNSNNNNKAKNDGDRDSTTVRTATG